jgi:hypothetical protein
MNLTLSVDEDTLENARRRAEALGTSVNQLVRDYLRQLAGESDPAAEVEEFRKLSLAAKGNSKGWKFNREDAYRRG